jgi:hypothetical protein
VKILAERALRGALVFCPLFTCLSSARATEPIAVGEIKPLSGALGLTGPMEHHGSKEGAFTSIQRSAR